MNMDRKIKIFVVEVISADFTADLKSALLPCCYVVEEIPSDGIVESGAACDLLVCDDERFESASSTIQFKKAILFTKSADTDFADKKNVYTVFNFSEKQSVSIVKAFAEGMWADGRVMDLEERTSELAFTLGNSASAGKFFLAVLHDIKNSLAVISGHAQTMETSPIVESGNDPDLLFSIKTIEKHVSTLLKVLSILSAIGKKQSPVISKTAVSSLVENLKTIFSSSSRKLEAEFILFVSDDAPEYIDTDLEFLTRAAGEAIFNSFNNLSQDAKKKINVNIFTEPGADFIIEIVDNGSGLREGAESRLFENYFSTNSNASGLGLPFARTLLSKIGGTIEAKPNKNHGTTIRITVSGGE